MASNNTLRLPVSGMDSEHCALIVDKALAGQEGVLQHKVELNNRLAVLEIDENKTDVRKLVNAIRDIGYDVPSVKKTYPVTGMTCASCAVSAESISGSLSGVIKSNVNFANSSLQIEFVPDIVSLEKIRQALQSIGYDIIIDEDNSEELKEEAERSRYSKIKNQFIWSASLSVPLVIIGMFMMDMPYANWIMMGLATPVIFWFGRSYFINAWKQLKHFSSNMDTLVALSTGIAYVFSVFNTLFPEFWHSKGLHAHVYFESAAVIIAFISLGKLLEERAKSNTSSAIKKLMGMQARFVRIVHGSHEMEIPFAEVKPGDIIAVRPGEKIAVDGTVVSGSTYIDESMISGEPLAVLKEKDAKVFAGTINQKGIINFKAEKVGGETLLAQIIKMVREAQGSKAPVQKLVDRIASVFVPLVILISIITFIAWMYFGGEHAFTQALITSVTVLVIACPCALGLATPTAIMVGVGKGAENGVLIKDAESLELAYKVNAIVLDKTGTITEGKPQLSNIEWDEAASEKERSVFFSMEQKSEHPLAHALSEYFREAAYGIVDFDSYESVSGKGVKAVYASTEYKAGSYKYMLESDVMIPEKFVTLGDAWRADAKTVVYFSAAGKVMSMAAVHDKIKHTSEQAISRLKSEGIEVYMLTGDNAQTAAAVARQTGIENFKAEVLPSDKAAFIVELQKQGKVVAMVGDGINDSQALAQADVSIAMGKGSDIAMDVAKMTLISSDLNSVSRAFNLSRQTISTVRQNLFWAFIYNLIGIPIAAGVLYPFSGFLLDPMIAGAAMAFSSVSVVGNSLLLKFKKL